MCRTQEFATACLFRCGLWSGLFVAFIALALVLTPAASATAIATSSLQLQSLTITPSSGSIVFSPFASWYGIVSNSLGEGNGFNGNGVSGGSSASVAWATVAGSADALSLTESAASDLLIPGWGSAYGETITRVAYLPFSITGTSGPVTVQFTASLLYQQSLMTGAYAMAHSFVGFSSGVFPDIGILMLATSAKTIDANSSWAASGTWDLTASPTLMAGVQYNFVADLDTVSYAIVAPEPASLSLFFACLLVPLILARTGRGQHT